MDRSRVPDGADPNPELLALVRESMERVLQRSAVDMEFRRELLVSPRLALSRHFGRPLPESLDLRFVENRHAVTIVLPDPVPGWELDDAQLDSVNGGAIPLAVLVEAIAQATAA